MQSANQIQQAIRKLGERRMPLTRIYRSLYNENLFLAAYAKVYKNQGVLTPGTEEDTADGMNKERIHQIIEALRYERFRFRPVRRVTVPKKKGGQRPLGLPNFTEKLVQEVLRMILEAYYEPRFRDSSHGFRPKRGCHSALTQLYRQFHGVNWFIEGDIKACFDSIDHEKLMDILARDIHDGRFLNLIRLGLEAGVLEDWVYKPTLSGVPQGGIVSPILANIYLHELDTFIEDELIPQYTRGKYRARNPEARHLEYEMAQARQKNDGQAIQAITQTRRTIPSKDTHDPDFRRLHYVRYADDFILGFTGPKAEAEAIKQAIQDFLKVRLNLNLSVEKTLITHARTQHAKFLGYAVSIYQQDDKVTRTRKGHVRRSINGHVRLGIPYGLVTELTHQYEHHGKPTSELRLLAFSDAYIIDIYQSRFRGIAEYYKFAVDRSHLSKLKNVMQMALIKTLAHKYKLTAQKAYRQYSSTRLVDGQRYKTLEVRVPTSKGEQVFYWGAIPLKVVKPSSHLPIQDVSYRQYYTDVRSDLIQRFQADTCELCGKQGKCEVHHVRKLADIKKRWAGRRQKPEWVVRMMALRRKTLIVCKSCHLAIHAGQPTPSLTRNASTGEPCDAKVSRTVRRGDDGKVSA